MQWNIPKTVFRLAHRTRTEPHKAGLLGHCQNIKAPLLLYTSESRVVLVQCPQKQWLHLPAAQCVAKERKPFISHPPQPGVFRHKQWEQDVLPRRVLSSNATPPGTPSEKKEEPDPLQDRSISLYQRFKKTFRQYGKVLIPVHLITSGIWFGTFYYAAIKGVNVVPFLELIGLPDSVVNILKNSQSGNALTAYALFKIATPARYAVTLGGTSFTVKYLRSHGYMSTPPPVKEYLQDRMEETKELLTEKMEETKDRLTEKLQETKGKVSLKKKVE
ncbi:protein FAM210A [Hippopotamus amphibius kiboko]|uniref:protein FAM210A n=1 Tax=Hippopotamus amphibius kiboko TaxID=575201 RepID=UPI002592F084|nr:protein FAM210A [Hippopotamus amphibius kiboko]XP_057554956.1 protein FAM210A [Hippopotamus amphibius kiboko]XP_057554957.1 protein FAM210A [Hippopotamus amphibius kiboko]XP_057554958.1 protein FAM210A [Hippopotamus amphibius kiboko]XP_057554959.1 protein FAM210A [Hippopotamus amphibius kiboko]XP_057554961.1 protein FAM210A [Hippopotamus amphibius kiboko]XP_057554962.1 protein FAM210A [Hippopotamus amphibius kiboko]XP_057554963.1 protein FAM210A [Hippopotamus amphibius kiboko]XP_05755496